MTVSFGPAIARLILNADGPRVLDRCNDVRREIAREVGVVFPGVNFRDDIRLRDFEYTIRVRDFVKAKGSVVQGRVLAIGSNKFLAEFDGEDTHDPVFGLAAKWIAEGLTEDARARSLKVFDPVAVIASHLGQVIREHLATIFTLDGYALLYKHVKLTYPVLMEEVDRVITRRIAHRTYRVLLEEMVWPRDPLTTFEQMLEASDTTLDPVLLAESMRKILVPAMLLTRGIKKMTVYRIDTQHERQILDAVKASQALIDTEIGTMIRKSVAALAKVKQPVHLLCTAPCRRAIAELFFRGTRNVLVYAIDEIPRALILYQSPLLLHKVQQGATKAAATKPEPARPVPAAVNADKAEAPEVHESVPKRKARNATKG